MTPDPITVHDVSGTSVQGDLVGRQVDGSLLVRGHDGRRMVVPVDAITHHDDAGVYLSVPLDTVQKDARDAPPTALEREVMPLVEEELVVETRPVTTGVVQVRTHTHERVEEIDEVLTGETVDVKRVPVERYVETPAAIRQEGDTTIVPLHEEVIVVEKRLVLKEELHLTKRSEERRETQRVTVRSQSADIERIDTEDA